MQVRADVQKWASEVAEQIKKKMLPVAERSKDKIPYTTKDGVFDDCSSKERVGWWTNGFWGGMMWQLYHATKEPVYQENAIRTEEKLKSVLMMSKGLDHDNGFKWLPTAVANYRLTENEDSQNSALLALDNLAGRFNPAGRFIRAWNDDGSGEKAGWAIIDCMMNLPLLYWGAEVRNDPRYYHIATMHADTAMKYFVRPDGSVNHIVEFDPMTGEFVKTYGGQGVEVGSSWTRGQAWAVYGFTLSYIHTGKQEYLDTAKRVANYFIANTRPDGLIPVDFRQPVDCTLEDTTAAAIAACGMLEISAHVEGTDKVLYLNAALRMLKALYEKRCNLDPEVDNLLEKGTEAYHANRHEISIIYGDYYFIEAIFKLTGEELFIW